MMDSLKENVKTLFGRFVTTKNGFIPGIKFMRLLNDVTVAVLGKF
jgi:hypothetical protein